MEHKIEQPKSKSESTNENDSISRNKVSNDTMEQEFEPLNSRNESKDKRYSIFSNNLDNDTIKYEIKLQRSKL